MTALGWKWQEAPDWLIYGLMSIGLLLILYGIWGWVQDLRSRRSTAVSPRAESNKPSALPLTVAVVPPESGNAGTYRFRVNNPNDDPITEVYGKYRNYRAINRPGWRLRWGSNFPSDGIDLPWEGTSQTIGAHSSEYLLLLKQGSRSLRHYGPNGNLTRYLNGGSYEFDLEIGSKTNGTPIFHHVQIAFSGLTDFDVEIIPPAPNTESEPPQPAPEAHPEK